MPWLDMRCCTLHCLQSLLAGLLLIAEPVLSASNGGAWVLTEADLQPARMLLEEQPLPVILSRDQGIAEERATRPPIVAPLEVGQWLNQKYESGLVAGNVGDLYENRDSGHSRLRLSYFPQLTPVEYRLSAPERLPLTGVQTRVVHPRPTIGNASLAVTAGMPPRSLPRMLFHNTPYGPTQYLLYRANQIYLYPEHRDHDDVDHFALNTPYLLITQGSSGSDRPFLQAIAATLAAFKPEVKIRLTEEGMLMPVLQYLLRSSYRTNEGDYFNGISHPTVFNIDHLDVSRMVHDAFALRGDSLPPLAMLKVLKEPSEESGVSSFDAGLSEELLTTPCAIARLARGKAGSLTYRLSALKSFDLNEKPLTYQWKILRGNPESIHIRPLLSDHSIVEITIDYPDAPTLANPESFRIDIGLFASNEAHSSPPAFFSVYFPPNQTRSFDSSGKLLAIDYQNHRSTRFDPTLFPHKPWKDTYVYAEGGTLKGWTRESANGATHRFNADGELLAPEASWKSAGQAVRYNRTWSDEKWTVTYDAVSTGTASHH
ncbi:MAG: hypothetical protein ACFB21_06660 [Opitutales bacterium]